MHTDSGVSGEEDGSFAPTGYLYDLHGIGTIRLVCGRQLIEWNVDELSLLNCIAMYCVLLTICLYYSLLIGLAESSIK